MRRALGYTIEEKVTHARRAPMRFSANCGIDLDEVSIGGEHKFNIAWRL